jgi:hypothetical protein
MTGMISDDQIIEVIGDKIIGHTHKFQLHKKPTNQQRAIWWNSERQTKSGVMRVRADELTRREVVKADARKTAERKAAKVLADTKKLEIDHLFLGNLVIYRNDQYHICYCDNDCNAIARTVVYMDDGWRGCPVQGSTKYYRRVQVFCPELVR